MTGIIWPAKLKLFTSWPVHKNHCAGRSVRLRALCPQQKIVNSGPQSMSEAWKPGGEVSALGLFLPGSAFPFNERLLSICCVQIPGDTWQVECCCFLGMTGQLEGRWAREQVIWLKGFRGAQRAPWALSSHLFIESSPESRCRVLRRIDQRNVKVVVLLITWWMKKAPGANYPVGNIVHNEQNSYLVRKIRETWRLSG